MFVWSLSRGASVIVLLATAIAFQTSQAQGLAGDSAPAKNELQCGTTVRMRNSVSLAHLSARNEVYTLRDLTDTADPAKNLAIRYPTIVMDAAQTYALTLKKFPQKAIKDPYYPIRNLPFFPLFSGALPELDGSLIIGQFDALSELVDYMLNAAAGRSQGKAMLFVGPPGTGKTELLNILDKAVDHLAATDPAHYEYTYRWKSLEKIPYLKPLVADSDGNLFITPLQRSPLTLLPREIQARIIGTAAPRVRELLDLEPQPFLMPDPQAAEIINAIMSHYMAKNKIQTLTEDQYVSFLEKHVEIVRRMPDPSRPPGIIRYQGKHPDPAQLFFSQNMYLSQIYGTNSAFSYNYNGVVPRRDGRGVFFDELLRNEEGLLNTLLELMQNGVVEAGGAPALYLNSIMLAASNDESVAAALKKMAINANLNRMKKVPMVSSIHPVQIAQTTLVMYAKHNLPSLFKIRDLTATEDQLRPANLIEMYPLPTPKGELKSPDGRLAVYAIPSPGKKILVAPHSFDLLGLTVAGTRLVTDPKILTPFASELNIVGPDHTYFTSVRQRLEIITRRMAVPDTALADLSRLHNLLREGNGGISARDAERWLTKAMSIAEKGNVPLTPVVIDAAFRDMMDKNEFVDNVNELRAKWLNIHSAIKADFILPALTADIQAIVGGEGGMVDKVYESMRSEILELAANPEAEIWFDAGAERVPINKVRYGEIVRIYLEINGEPFTPGRLKTYQINNNGGEQFLPLRRAIEKYLLQKELDTQALTSLLEYFDGRSVSGSTQELGRRAEGGLTRVGYDRASFRQALRFVRDEQFELERRNRAARDE